MSFTKGLLLFFAVFLLLFALSAYEGGSVAPGDNNGLKESSVQAENR